MTPKSLLRHPLAASNLAELVHGSFQRVIDIGPPAASMADLPRPTSEELPAAGKNESRPTPPGYEAVTRLLLCSGKFAVDLLESEARPTATAVAIAKLEELYPFPRVELEAVLARYPTLREVGVGTGGAGEHGRVELCRAPAAAPGQQRHRRALHRPPAPRQPGGRISGSARRRAGAHRRRRLRARAAARRHETALRSQQQAVGSHR